ncbi:hypothetical protein N7474_004989 [Penicillium riverlandense]|uniref:uncharacterized protein n=1 Tax=Penicillium riverlandense TaxID=1903569 RepID=UPI00254677AD|nr:uncharacterized protein N7474_004989 [Penicillium riverlandense]KAJ5819398.1 hypothetical protein N7474_004989 [Penicillium riverlandense]
MSVEVRSNREGDHGFQRQHRCLVVQTLEMGGRETPVRTGANVATAADPYLITEIIGGIQLLIPLSASAHGREPNVWR